MEMRLWGSSQERTVKGLRNSKLAEEKKKVQKKEEEVLTGSAGKLRQE